VPILLVGVTSHQGGRESRLQGEGAQVSAVDQQGGRRDAYSHNCGTTARVSGWSDTGKRSARKPACCVWGGADGKGLGNQHLASGLLYLAHPTWPWRFRCPADLKKQQSHVLTAPASRRMPADAGTLYHGCSCAIMHKDSVPRIVRGRFSS